MKDYPHREALRKAHDIYRDAMRPFIVRCLKRVRGEKVEDLILDSLDDREVEQFKQDLQQYNGSLEASIDIKHFPNIIKKYWYRDRAFSQQFGSNSKVQYKTGTIGEGRNSWAHPGIEDVNPEFTRMHLSLVVEALGEIKEPDAKAAVEAIRDRLFSHETEEHLMELEKAELDKYLKIKSDRLEDVEKEKAELEKCLKTALEQLEVEKAEYEELLEAVETEKIEIEKQLGTVSTRLEELEKKWHVHGKHLKTPLDHQLEAVNREKVKYEKGLKAVLNQLATLKAVNAKLEERLETTSTRLKDVEAELTACKEHLALTLRQLEGAKAEQMLPNAGTSNSITFQGTLFTKRLNKYHVSGDDITQTFWYYWRAQGRDGKQKMREAGWSVEKVGGDWEVTISPEDFEAWIENEVTQLNNLLKLNNLLNSSQNKEPLIQPMQRFSERTILPTGKEIEQPALEFLSDEREHRRVEIIDRLTEHFSLTDDERSYLSKTGQAEKHLMNKGLIKRTRKGYYRITTRGLQVLG